MPVYQEIEFFAAPQYAHACNDLELSFVAGPHVDVILEVDKRGGLFTGDHDVHHHFQVPHTGAEHTDWAAQIDAWLRQTVTAHAGHASGGYGTPHGYGAPYHSYGAPTTATAGTAEAGSAPVPWSPAWVPA